ncbi:MAG TPA: glutamyl-tRNA amidotransferase [Alphaproteobacteria bacterium]|nr:glutamyl-tRNA amidotransferase [Alphaproteobacteria bacterium]
MLRKQISVSLQEALKAKNQTKTSTLRLILAALKDRDIAERSKGNDSGLNDDAILKLLQSMIKQRKESIEFYEKGNRLELADKEKEEINHIKNFLPKQLSENEVKTIVKSTISELGAKDVRDMGKVMSFLREKYSGQMDLSIAGKLLKEHLV